MSRTLPLLLTCALLCVALPVLAEPAAAELAADALVARQATGDAALIVLDVRSAEEFAAGHVPGAINVPHDALEGQLSTLPQLKDHDVVVYCKSGRRAGLALEVLARHGYTRLQHLTGDMEGWRAASRPVELTPPANAQPANAPPAPR
jgi:rhodanese-related sulfurtransferase